MEFTRAITVDLTDYEIQMYGHEQASCLLEIDEYDAQKKALSNLQKPIKARVSQLSTMINSGQEDRLIVCKWIYNWDRGTKLAKRLDNGQFTGIEVQIEAHEKQEELL